MQINASASEAIGERAISDAASEGALRGQSGSRSKRRFSSVWLGRIAFIVVVIAGWQFASGTIVDPFFVSKPSEIWRELSALVTSGSLLLNTLATLQEAAIGYAVGAISAVAFGFLLGRMRWLGEVLDPFVTAFFCIPKLAIAPLIILWFGIGLESKVVLAALLTFYMTFWNTYAGVQKVDNDLLNVVRVMGATPWQLTREVIFPASIGWTLVGLRMSVPYALMGAVVGEIMAGNKGLGYLVQANASQFNTAGVFAVLIVLAIIGSVINQFVAFLDQRSQRWNVTN
ncbi:MAG: ABC transporter permease [Pseudorhodoplanes sp.]|uniref:ABC transporter permease n=1 Tax=Pseudorhodoplanes sp. TaxID=1934341 RepID=UPI003D106C5F